ncbi:MAG: SPOR domain-containing protein [Bacteroidaceae bacterium]|nr:SPOR domain-containing protein [Bacteroidaceae bacterium]
MFRSRVVLLLLSVLFPLVGMAQEKYTDKLRQRGTSGAVVVVHQDAEIEELVNGNSVASRDTASVDLADEAKKEKTSGPHTKADGYRVQIYMAGNTANDKAVVKGYAKRFKSRFPNVNAYVSFNSPHWVCTVGDYKTREEANEMLKQVRSSFNTAYIVRSKINKFY